MIGGRVRNLVVAVGLALVLASCGSAGSESGSNNWSHFVGWR